MCYTETDAAEYVVRLESPAHFFSSGAVSAKAVVLVYGTHLVFWPREDHNLTAQAASLNLQVV